MCHPSRVVFFTFNCISILTWALALDIHVPLLVNENVIDIQNQLEIKMEAHIYISRSQQEPCLCSSIISVSKLSSAVVARPLAGTLTAGSASVAGTERPGDFIVTLRALLASR